MVQALTQRSFLPTLQKATHETIRLPFGWRAPDPPIEHSLSVADEHGEMIVRRAKPVQCQRCDCDTRVNFWRNVTKFFFFCLFFLYEKLRNAGYHEIRATVSVRAMQCK